MNPKKRCPFCGKLTDKDSRFCVHCGKKFLEGVYCLNCGRPVEENQEKCQCGYELAEITCPECGRKNPYTNRFCVSCSEKLWKSEISTYRYDERLFEIHMRKTKFPRELRNLTVDKRRDRNLIWYHENKGEEIAEHLGWNDATLQRHSANESAFLYEICSRWAIVSPNYCIKCRKQVIGPCSCVAPYLHDQNRIKFLKNSKNSYREPEFDIDEIRWTSKYKSYDYLSSLAPAVGESQLDYRERLKWDFEAALNRKTNIPLKSAPPQEHHYCTVYETDCVPPYDWEWDLECMTQDAWELREMERHNQLVEDLKEKFKD